MEVTGRELCYGKDGGGGGERGLQVYTLRIGWRSPEKIRKIRIVAPFFFLPTPDILQNLSKFLHFQYVCKIDSARVLNLELYMMDCFFDIKRKKETILYLKVYLG